MPRYVTYQRVSTREQGKSGLGLDAQERDIRLFLESYSEEPWEVIGAFVEIQSGAEDDRHELAKAIALAKREKAILLVSKLDRLSRKVSFIASLMDDKKLAFKVACMPYADKFQLHIHAALAEQEREFISQRTKAALREAKNNGRVLGGLRPGTAERNEGAKLAADDRARKLETIVKPLREANASLRDIAAALNGAGIKTARGCDWSASTVMRILDRI